MCFSVRPIRMAFSLGREASAGVVMAGTSPATTESAPSGGQLPAK